MNIEKTNRCGISCKLGNEGAWTLCNKGVLERKGDMTKTEWLQRLGRGAPKLRDTLGLFLMDSGGLLMEGKS